MDRSVTRVLELRRHSRRSGADANLNQSGVALARSLGASMGPFALVVSSPAERAIQTAVAMGFAIDRIEDALALPEQAQLALELDMCKSFADVAMLLRASARMADYALRLRGVARELVDEIDHNQSALAISHGGVLETMVAGCLADGDDMTRIRALGAGFRFCEGARLTWDGAAFSLLQLLRVDA
jgi:broad specificity phosphatase PhoE